MGFPVAAALDGEPRDSPMASLGSHFMWTAAGVPGSVLLCILYPQVPGSPLDVCSSPLPNGPVKQILLCKTSFLAKHRELLFPPLQGVMNGVREQTQKPDTLAIYANKS